MPSARKKGQCQIREYSQCLRLVCYNRTPEAGHSIKKRDSFLTVLEVGESRVEGPASCKGFLA